MDDTLLRQVEQFGFAHHCGQRQATGDRLAQDGEVGYDTVFRYGAAERDAETRDQPLPRVPDPLTSSKPHDTKAGASPGKCWQSSSLM